MAESREAPPLLRRLVGDALRGYRTDQGRTLRDVAAAARVSVPYLSEVERGRKEASSEVLAAVCKGLDVRLSDLLEQVRRELLARETPVVAPGSRRPVGDPSTRGPKTPGPRTPARPAADAAKAAVPAAAAPRITLTPPRPRVVAVMPTGRAEPELPGPTCQVTAAAPAGRPRRGTRRPARSGRGHAAIVPAAGGARLARPAGGAARRGRGELRAGSTDCRYRALPASGVRRAPVWSA
jgi:hypothetical protein